MHIDFVLLYAKYFLPLMHRRTCYYRWFVLSKEIERKSPLFIPCTYSLWDMSVCSLVCLLAPSFLPVMIISTSVLTWHLWLDFERSVKTLKLESRVDADLKRSRRKPSAIIKRIQFHNKMFIRLYWEPGSESWEQPYGRECKDGGNVKTEGMPNLVCPVTCWFLIKDAIKMLLPTDSIAAPAPTFHLCSLIVPVTLTRSLLRFEPLTPALPKEPKLLLNSVPLRKTYMAYCFLLLSLSVEYSIWVIKPHDYMQAGGRRKDVNS